MNESGAVTHWNKVFDHIHVWQGVNLGWFAEIGVNLVQTGQCVSSINVHSTGSTNTYSEDI